MTRCLISRLSRLVAVMLGRLEMPIDQAIEMFNKIMGRVFSSKNRNAISRSKTLRSEAMQLVWDEIGNGNDILLNEDLSCQMSVVSLNTFIRPELKLLSDSSVPEILAT